MSSEIDNVLISPLDNNKSDTKVHSNYNYNNITPIKFVDKSLYKNVMKVVRGVGTCLTVVAVPQLLKNGKQMAKRVWRVLLDSGSAGDLLFVHRSNTERIPQKERFTPQNGRPLMELLEQQKLVT